LRLKSRARSSDLRIVKTPPELTCPICQADIPLGGDEQPGDEVFCTYCGAPCLIAGKVESPEEWAAEEDF
jgi:DNA-directed RNA polymerase subunit RPC12/RpoP